MSLSEHVAEVERRIAARLSEAVDEMRRAILTRSERATSELTADLDTFRDRLPARWLEELDLASFERPSRAEARQELTQSLKATLLALDGASTQREILEALLQGARGTADRAAVWLTRDGELAGWGSVGFGGDAEDDPIAGARLTYESSPGLARLSRGRGSIRLGAADAARLASDLEISAPKSAALVPMVLRDRLAAALYVDRAEGEVEIELAQILAQAAAQRLELQAFSARSYTPTLVLDEEAPLSAAGLPLWNPDEIVDEEVPAAELPASAVAMPAAELFEPPTEEFAPAPVAKVVEAAWFRPAPAPIEEEPVLAVDDEQETLSEAMPTFAAPSLEPIAPPTFSAPFEPSAPAGAEIAWELEDADATVLMGATGRPALPEDAATTGEIPFARDAEKAPEETTAPFAVPVISSQATQAIRTGGIATHEFPLPEPEIADDATVMIQRSTVATPIVPVVAPPAPHAEAPEEQTHPSLAPNVVPDDEPTLTRGAARTTEVVPPPDVQGPGWAFTATRTQRATGENALHEEARRLARLLVSEIKLYNEEQVEEGRRNRDVYHRLKEDIDRSRQIYEERVHESVRGATDYFQQELVRSLAGGDARALGI